MPRVRPATAGDLPEVYDIYYESEVDGAPDPPPRGGVPAFLTHELETGDMHVAEAGGRLVGFAAAVTRGQIWYLAELFVRARYQSAGVGQALLRAVLPTDGRIVCTLGSRDFRALALYARAGLRPLWPNLWLRARTADLCPTPDTGAEMVAADPQDPALLEWDTRIGGRSRPADHEYWVRELWAVPFWIRQKGTTVGYAYVQMRSPGSLWFPDAITIGPIGAVTPADALGAVRAAVRYAAGQAAMVRIPIPGPHSALPFLLDAGFQITYVETFAASAVKGLPDPACYLPSSGVF